VNDPLQLGKRYPSRKSEQTVEPNTPQLALVSPSMLAMLLTTKYADGLPLHQSETVPSRHGIDIPRQTLARWIIPCSEHLPPLLNGMRDRLLESSVIHCDETSDQG